MRSNYTEAETEDLARRSIGVDDHGPQFTKLHPDLVQQAFNELGFAYADLRAKYSLLESQRHGFRARIYMAHRNTGKSAADAKELAECDPRYQEYLSTIAEAERLMLRAKTRMDSFQAAYGTARTIAATERNAMRM